MADISLQLQADNLRDEDIERLFVEGRWKPIRKRLSTAENLLLEGCRGTGKTMLMRSCAERLAADARNGGDMLGVHATFKRYLATLPPLDGTESQELGAFKAWVNARILGATCDQVRSVFGEHALEDCGKIGSIDWTRVIAALETTYRGEGVPLDILKQTGLDDAGITALQGYTLTIEFLKDVRRALNLRAIVLLLDDAAHALDTRAQAAFFTLVKSLYSPGLSFKIAVYPAVTRYGVDFSYGHDAVVVTLDEVPSRKDMGEFEEMLRRRIASPDADSDAAALIAHLLEHHVTWIHLLVFCASGNPRSVFKLIAQLLTELRDRPATDVRYDDVRSAINSVIDRHLDNMIPGVVKDLNPRLLRAAEELLFRFREKISSQPGPLQGEQPRMFLAIANSLQIPYVCTAATRLLVAANVLTYAGALRLSKSENGSAYLLHPGFVFRDNVLGGSVTPERWLEHFGSMSPRVHAEVSRSASLWSEVREIAMQEPGARCSNGHPMPESGGICEECGARIDAKGPAAVLLEKSIDVLDLSDRIKERLRTAGYSTVRRVFEASEAALDDIPYIGEQRLKVIRSAVGAAVDEFFAG